MSFSLLFLSMLACTGGENKGFSSLGQTSLDPNAVNPQGDADVDDTGIINDQDNPNAPVISDIQAFFTEVPAVGMCIEIHVFFSDEQNDLSGGAIEVSYLSSSVSASTTVNINGTDAILEEGEITFIFQDVDPEETYEFEIVLRDAAGNASTAAQAVAVALEE